MVRHCFEMERSSVYRPSDNDFDRYFLPGDQYRSTPDVCFTVLVVL